MTISITKKQARDYELIAASWHEASHTICALVNYIFVNEVYVITDKPEGRTLYEIYDYDTVKDKKLKRILILNDLKFSYAGIMGEKSYYQDICGSEKFPMHLKIGSYDDLKQASAIISKHDLAPAGKERTLLKRQIQEDVVKTLRLYWSDIRLISHSLYEKKRLTYKDIKQCLTKKSENRFFWKQRFKDLEIIFGKKDVGEDYLMNLLYKNYLYI